MSQRVGCSVSALRKIETGERRPSKQLAQLLVSSLEIPPNDRVNFIKAARGELNIERLSLPALTPSAGFKPATKPGPARGNLPEMLTPFLGREPELAAISRLMRDPQCRLLTLVGPGGIGKTRLALEVAARNKDLFPDGQWFVPLAPLSSPELLVPAIADALNFRFQDPAEPERQLLSYLHNKKALLILDNIEHLLDGIRLLTEILKSSSQTKLLVTSRERMNLLSEWVFEIQGLPVPPNGQVEQFERFSSVGLFLQGARRVQAGFDLHAEERPWVARICQVMDGMPLGIELASAWVGLLTCEEIAREIERNLDFLTISMLDLPERHRSLRASLDHSWKLLNAEEKVILSRLSVFRGSFRRAAAEEICGASLTVLASLKSKSLLRRADRDRYNLHELIHQYTVLRLAEDAREEERLKDRHAVYFAQRLSEWEHALKSSKQTETLEEMADEIDNLPQAWQRMVTCCRSARDQNNLFSLSLFHSSLFSLSLFYELRCRNLEAISLFEESVESVKAARDACASREENMYFAAILGHITAYLGLHHAYILQYQQASELLVEALSLLENGQARLEKAQAQIMLAWIYLTQGHIRQSVELLEQNLSIFREEGDTWWYTLNITHLAWAYLSLGKIEESQSLYQEGLRLVESGDLRLGLPLRNGFAYSIFLQHDYPRAEQLLMENLELSEKLGFKRQTANVYLDLGQVALATNRIELAERNFEHTIDLLSEFGESHDLALGLAYSGKCLTARMETAAARKKFLQVIQIGQALNIFHLVYWGLVNLAKNYLTAGQSEPALQIALTLKQYSVESKIVQDDGFSLMAELEARLSPQQIEAAIHLAVGSSIESLLERIE